MGHRLEIDPIAFPIGALCLLIIPLQWGLGAFLAICVHELCHCIAVWIAGGKILHFRITAGGMILESSPVEPLWETFSVLAGPLGSFSMLCLVKIFPEASLFGAVQGAYNLLPIYPLDGGRLMRLLLPESICNGVELVTIVAVTAASIYSAVVFRLGVYGMIPGILLWWKFWIRKIPCIAAKVGVQ